jgi:hypothetical protein
MTTSELIENLKKYSTNLRIVIKSSDGEAKDLFGMVDIKDEMLVLYSLPGEVHEGF